MQLVAMTIAVNVVTDNSSITQTKDLTSLLTNLHALGDRCRTIALRKLLGISIGFDRAAKVLGRHQVQILDVICIQRSSLGTRGRFSNSGQTVPSNALGIYAVSRNVQNTMIYASFIQTLTSLIPNNFRHSFILL